MAEVRYSYGPDDNAAGYNTVQLSTEITNAGLPTHQVYGSGYSGPGDPICTDVQVGFDPDIDALQKTTLDGVIAAHVPQGPRRSRLIFDIYNDIGFLSAVQKTKIWDDLSPGNPPKWAKDRGMNAADLHIIWMLATQLAVVSSAGDKNLCRQMLIAIYTQDNPNYLVHPPFDNTINIPGDEPIP